MKQKSVINPMMDFALDTNANGDIEMVGNSMRSSSSSSSSGNRKKQYGRKRGRTMSIIDNLKNETSQQSMRFKSVVSRSKRLKELNAKVKARRDEAKKNKKLPVISDDVEKDQHIDIGLGWFRVVVGKSRGSRIIYFNKKTGSVNDKNPFGLKDGYEMLYDDASGDFYYYNESKDETTWERPRRGESI